MGGGGLQPFLGVVPRLALFLQLAHEQFHRHRAGHISGPGPAHAVTDHCKAPAILQLPDGIGILVLLAHRTSVGDSP